MRDNEDATAGGLLTLVAVFLLAGFLFIAGGWPIDRISDLGISSFSALPANQLRFEVFNLMVTTWRTMPIIILIGGGFNYIIHSMRQFSGPSSIGDMIYSASEMILGSVVIMALEMFGGGALETVTSAASGLPAETGSFVIIQYLPGAFYGFCLIAMIGLIINYLIVCASVIDYSTSQAYGAF